jgi:NAD(P)-dependent dehydrogenase (short-subunit alcohol dehydrogenase family)
MGELVEQPLDEWRRMLDINLTGPLLVARHTEPLLEEGSLINITSGLAWHPMASYNGYCVTKAGLNMLTRALAEELGPNVAVNAVDPGVAKTRMNPSAPQSPDRVVRVLHTLAALGREGPTGRCFKTDGSEVPF